jgi:hypothetical protein
MVAHHENLSGGVGKASAARLLTLSQLFMRSALVQFQVQVMLKTIHPQQFHPVSCTEDIRVMGDRRSGINKATHTCHH